MGDSLETVQPAGIMHYGAPFTQKSMLMMREVMGWVAGGLIMPEEGEGERVR